MLSRRHLLQAGGLASGLGLLGALAAARPANASDTIYAYVGTYTDPARSWRGQGLHQFVLDAATGALRPIPGAPAAVPSGEGEAARLRNPTALTAHPTLPVVYAVNGFDAGSVSTFRVGANGALEFVSETSCGGKGPAYVSVHPDGRFLFTANYRSGDVGVLALGVDGLPLPDRPVVVYKDVDACGAATPCKPGPNEAPALARSHRGFALSDHDGPHAHMVESDPSGNFVLVADLGLDRVITYRFDRATGVLSQPSSVAVAPGAGARHFIFHRNGKWFYLVNEEASSVAFMTYDASTGVLTPVSDTSALPAGFEGTSYASGIRMLPGGRHFVVLNRLHDSIALFQIDPRTGAPSLVRQEWTRGSYPRSCTIDPTGRFLYVCHNRSDNVTVFNIGKGDIAFSGRYLAVGSAAAIEFFVPATRQAEGPAGISRSPRA